MDTNLKVNIVIKNANSRIADHHVEFDVNGTIGQLKEQLSKVYVNNPAPELQKIIFAGKLLQDSQTIGEVLKQYDIRATHTFHIVTSRPQIPPVENLQPQQQPQQPQQPQQQAQPFPFQNFQFQQVPFNVPPQQPLHPMAFHAQLNMNMPQGVHPNSPYGQYHAYMQQQYQQFMLQQGVPPHMIGPIPPHLLNPNMNIPFPPQPQQAAPLPNANPQQPPQPRARNDYTQGLWLAIKLVFMVYILSQGGTTTRSIVLGVGALLVFLFQTGRLRIVTVHHHLRPQQQQQPQRQQQQLPQQQQQPVQEPQNNQQPDNVQNQDNNNNNGNNNNDHAQPQGQQQQQQQQQQLPQRNGGFLNELSGVILPFFYSLLPGWTPGGAAAAAAPQPPVDDGMQWN